MKNRILLCLLLILPMMVFPQGEFNHWCFGVYNHIAFNSGVPVNMPNSAMSVNGGSISVSDSAGNLLFYSAGDKIYNRNNVVMPNGNGLGGSTVSLTSNTLSVQSLVDDSLYFILTGGYPSVNPVYLSHAEYSVLDMRLNGTLGDIVAGQKNIRLRGGYSGYGPITGIRKSNNRDAWILLRLSSTDSNYFVANSITAAGVDTVPVFSSSLVHVQSITSSTIPPRQIKISPDGKTLVCTYTFAAGNDSLEVCDFSLATGQVTPRFTCQPWYQGQPLTFSSVEFSTDSRLLYFLVQPDAYHGYILQYDATAPDSTLFRQSMVMVGTAAPHHAMPQMGPDWKIYFSPDIYDTLQVINNPSVNGAGCNFQRAGFHLVPGNHADGLPQFVHRYKAYIHDTGNCMNSGVLFSGDIWPPADSIHWDFGDPAAGASNVSLLPSPQHVYSDTGLFTVTLFVRHIDLRTDTSWKTIQIILSPTVNLGPDKTICSGDTATFTASPCSACSFIWKDVVANTVVGTSGVFRTPNPGIYSIREIQPNSCEGRDTVQLFTTPVPAVTNSPLSKSICSGSSTNITLTSGVPGTNFYWNPILTSGSVTGFSPDSGTVINQALVNMAGLPGIVTYTITPKIGNCFGLSVPFTVTVNPKDTVKVAITSSGNSVCAGTPVTFSAAPTNGGTTPFYQWKVNGGNVGTNSPVYTYAPANGDNVTCVLTSSKSCITGSPATGNSLLMVINSVLVVGVSVSASANPVCAGTSVIFTATPVNGGTSPSYQWYVNNNPVGTNSPVYTYIPNNGDLVKCRLTSSEPCTTNNPASSIQYPVSVNPNLPVSISISPSQNPFCIGASVTFTATPANGGTTPSYQWKVNGVNAGSNSPVYAYFPANGDLVSCTLLSSEPCTTGNPASSNQLTMTAITIFPAGVSIAASTNPFCPGSAITFTATPGNGGPGPFYQWKVNGVNSGTNSPVFSFNPQDGDSVRCVMTSNLPCVSGSPATSNKIILNGTLAPLVTFTACFDTITTVNAKPIKLKGGTPLGGTYSGAGVNSVAGTFTPSVAGIGNHTITYSYTNVSVCSASKTKTIAVLSVPAFTCGNNVADIRTGRSYQTVQLGTQCWFAEDLDFGSEIPFTQNQRDNCIAEKYSTHPSPLTSHSFYQWDELMHYDDTPGLQGLCPPAWHVPTEAEWNTLFANWINNAFAAAPLRYSGYSGFNALLSGAGHENVQWDFQDFAGFFWSSTPHGIYKAWAHGMNDVDYGVSFYPSLRSNAFSIRCLKD